MSKRAIEACEALAEALEHLGVALALYLQAPVGAKPIRDVDAACWQLEEAVRPPRRVPGNVRDLLAAIEDWRVDRDAYKEAVAEAAALAEAVGWDAAQGWNVGRGTGGADESEVDRTWLRAVEEAGSSVRERTAALARAAVFVAATMAVECKAHEGMHERFEAAARACNAFEASAQKRTQEPN
jgi:hypothetical protein